MSPAVSRATSAVSAISNAFFGQTPAQARINAIASYDQSNELFKVRWSDNYATAMFLTVYLFILKAFLSDEMMYSCALWSDEEGGVRGDLTSARKTGDLEVAQLRKIYHVLRKARVQPGDRILEFGSGWGGLAIEVSFKELFIRQDCIN